MSNFFFFFDPMDHNLPGSCVQAPVGFPRQEYWSGLPFPSSSWPRDQTHISYIGRHILYHCILLMSFSESQFISKFLGRLLLYLNDIHSLIQKDLFFYQMLLKQQLCALF